MKSVCFLNVEKQTYPFTGWKQDQSSSHFLHETGKEGRRTDFSTDTLFFMTQHTKKKIQYTKS